MKLTEKIAYMKGLLDGMELDSSTKEGKAILQMAEVMEEMGVYIDDLQSQVDELTELCDLLDHDLDVILVDDGSTDISGAMCDAYAEFDERVRTLHTPNRGLSS